MKTIATILVTLLAALASAQTSQPPITVTFSSDSAFVTSVSNKEIALFTVMVTYKELPNQVPSAHDLYFKSEGLPPGEKWDAVHGTGGDTITNVVPVFVQFADGTTWGDDNDRATQDAIARRTGIRDLLTNAMAAYQSGQDQGLINYLTSYSGVERGFASRYLNIQKTSGTAAALQQIQSRANTAQSRPF